MIMTKRIFSRQGLISLGWIMKGEEVKSADCNPIHGASNAIEGEGATIS